MNTIVRLSGHGNQGRIVLRFIKRGAPSSPPSLKTLRFHRLGDRLRTIATQLCYTVRTTSPDQGQGNAQENGRAAVTQSLYTIALRGSCFYSLTIVYGLTTRSFFHGPHMR